LPGSDPDKRAIARKKPIAGPEIKETFGVYEDNFDSQLKAFGYL
jgi:hypothetical protein